MNNSNKNISNHKEHKRVGRSALFYGAARFIGVSRYQGKMAISGSGN